MKVLLGKSSFLMICIFFRSDGIIGQFFFKNVTGNTTTVNGEYNKGMFRNFLLPEFLDMT